jgi:hypothetical protein
MPHLVRERCESDAILQQSLETISYRDLIGYFPSRSARPKAQKALHRARWIGSNTTRRITEGGYI